MSTKNKILIYIVGTIALGLAIIFLVILPAAKDIIKLNEAVRLERIDLEKKYQRGMLLKKTISNFQEVKPYGEILDSVFVIKDKELEFITSLEKIAAENSLIQTIKLVPLVPAKGQKSTAYEISALTVNLEGQYPDLIKYLSELESLAYQVNIGSIYVNAESESAAATLKGEVFIIEADEL